MFLVVMTALQASSSVVRTSIFAALIIWAGRSTICAIQSLTLATLIIFANTRIAAAEGNIAYLKWVLLAVVLARVLIDQVRNGKRIPKVFVSFMLFCVTVLITGYAVSAQYAVTVFKLMIFVVAVVISLLGFSARVRQYDWESWFYTLFATVLAMSIPFVFFGAGYDVTGRLFQGVFCHPQAFGVFIAPFATWLIVEFLKNRGRREFLILFLITFVMLAITRARTSMLAFALGAAATFLSAFRNASSHRIFRSSKFVMVASITTIGLLVGAMVARQAISDRVTGYIVKGYRAGPRMDMDEMWRSVQYSRKGQIDRSAENFSYNPGLGVGFGMTDRFGITAKGSRTFWGIPLSTESEMGFIFLAILGQTGLVGSILFLVFLFYLYEPIFSYGDPGWIALSTTAFFVNFGETILFSSGGLGAFSWLIIGYAHLDSIRRRSENKILAKYRQPAPI